MNDRSQRRSLFVAAPSGDQIGIRKRRKIHLGGADSVFSLDLAVFHGIY